MRILYIAHTTDAEGSSAALMNIVRGMRGHDVELAVACPDGKGPMVAELRAMGVKLFIPASRFTGFYTYPQTRNPLVWLKRLLGTFVHQRSGRRYLMDAVQAFRPDIIHTNSSACTLGWEVARRCRIPHVWHVREYMDLDFGLTPIPTRSRQLERLHSPGNFNIAITQGIFRHFHLRAQDTCIYDGVIDASRTVGPSPLTAYPYFLFVGNVIRAKGVESLISQFLAFHASHPLHHLVLAGAYDREPALYAAMQQQVADAGLSDFVHFLGRRSDVYELMSGAVALVVPSRNEGFGFITAEAMYCHCLVIGRDTAGTREQFDKGLAETGGEIALRFSSDAELPRLMHSAITDDFSDMKRRAHDVVLRNYTLQANATKLYSFYKRTIHS